MTKKKSLRRELNVSEKVIILAERIRQKSAPVNFIKKQLKTVLILTKKMCLQSEIRKKK